MCAGGYTAPPLISNSIRRDERRTWSGGEVGIARVRGGNPRKRSVVTSGRSKKCREIGMSGLGLAWIILVSLDSTRNDSLSLAPLRPPPFPARRDLLPSSSEISFRTG